MDSGTRFLTFTSILMLALILQVVLAVADQRDTPEKAAVEFAEAYYRLDPSMADRLCAGLAPGKAAVEAFFTAKGRDVFAILPRWPGRTFRLQGMTGVKAVRLLGSDAPVAFTAGADGVAVTLPALPAALRAQPAWVLKVSR